MEDSCLVSDTLLTTPFISLLASIVVAAIFGGIFLLQQWKPYDKMQPDTTTAVSVPPKIDASLPHQVPFVVLKDPEWKDIGYALETYEEEVTVLMNGLSRSLEVARESEWDMFVDGMEPTYLLSKQLQQRINRLSTLLEENTRLLRQELLIPFPVTKLLPNELTSDTVSWAIQNTPSPTEPPHRAMKQTMESSAYDSVSQVMAHITRDWTVLGTFVRKRMYDWCRREIASRLALGDSILVPGSGLGRLAFDLACDGYLVEANEISLLMASAAHAILHRQVRGTLYPFLMDYFTNEVHSEWRYESVPFPDVDVSYDIARGGGSLSYTIGDFVETYAASHRQHDGIVTCFFLDTATNIYEYLWTIQQVLRVHGVWVHVGPLQWHRNALLHPSADELKGLVETFGFDIVHWSIDLEPIDYRYEDTTTARSTKYEAFKPLRMVAIRRETTKSSLLPRFLQRQQQYTSKSKKDANPVNQILSQVVIEEL